MIAGWYVNFVTETIWGSFAELVSTGMLLKIKQQLWILQRRAGHVLPCYGNKWSPTPKIATLSLYACDCYQDRDNAMVSPRLIIPYGRQDKTKSKQMKNVEVHVMLI